MGNSRSLSECDFCHKDVVTSLDGKAGQNGVDILRPFNPSFEEFLGIPTNHRHTGDIEICKSCAEKMVNYVEQVIMINKEAATK